MKKVAHCIVSLTLIFAVCVGVLAVVDSVTRERIVSLKQRAAGNAARLVMPTSVKAPIMWAKTRQGESWPTRSPERAGGMVATLC